MPRSRKLNFEGGLPDGTTTKSLSRYLRAWKNLSRPFREEFGWRPHSFEPGIVFLTGWRQGPYWPNSKLAETVQISDPLAVKLASLIREVQLLRRAKTPRTTLPKKSRSQAKPTRSKKRLSNG